MTAVEAGRLIERDEPVRVGLLFEYGTLNGGEFSMLSVLDQLNDADLDVLAICSGDGPLRIELKKRGLRCVTGISLARMRSATAEAEVISNLNGLIQENGLQLLHANSLTMGRRLGAISERLACPTTAHVRDIMSLSATAARSMNAHAGILCVSQATRDCLLSQGVHPEITHTIHNGIDCDQWKPGERTGWLHRELGIPEETPLIATIGQICLRKAQVDLAIAVTRLPDEVRSVVHTLIIGERHSTKQESIDFDNLIDWTFTDIGLDANSHRLGFRPDVREILPEIDLLVHPAVQEPFGRVLLEAAACGVAIIATRVGGTEELLTHGETALLVSPENPDELAAAITRLLSDGVLRNHLGTAARRQVESNFPVSRAAERLLSFWSETASTRGNSTGSARVRTPR